MVRSKTLEPAWENVDPNALKEVVSKTLQVMKAEERALFCEKLLARLDQKGISLGPYLVILGIGACTWDEITPLEWGHLIRYFQVNLPEALTAIAELLDEFPAFRHQVQGYYRMHLVKKPVRDEELIAELHHSLPSRLPLQRKWGLPGTSSYGTHGSPERVPGALVRAMATLFLQKNPNLSREALARVLRQRLLMGRIKYHVRTLKRQLTGAVSSVPSEVEAAMRELLLDGGGTLKWPANMISTNAKESLRKIEVIQRLRGSR